MNHSDAAAVSPRTVTCIGSEGLKLDEESSLGNDGRLGSRKHAACSAPVTGRPALSIRPIRASTLKAAHHDKRDRHFAPRRLHPRQEGGNVAVMGELISVSSTSWLSPMVREINLTLQSGTRPRK